MKTNIQQCPSCGAPIKIGSSNCEFCGNSIIIYAENNPNNKNSQHDDFTIVKPLPGVEKALDFLFKNSRFGSEKACFIIGPSNIEIGFIQYGYFGGCDVVGLLGFYIDNKDELIRFQNSRIYPFFMTNDNRCFTWYTGMPHLSYDKLAHVITIFLLDICPIPQNLIIFNIKYSDSHTTIINYDYNGNFIPNNIETNSDFCETTKVSKKQVNNDDFSSVIITAVFIFLTLLGLLIASTGYN